MTECSVCHTPFSKPEDNFGTPEHPICKQCSDLMDQYEDILVFAPQPPAEVAASDTLIVCGDDDTTVKQDVQDYVNHRYEQKIKELQAEITHLQSERDILQKRLNRVSEGVLEAVREFALAYDEAVRKVSELATTKQRLATAEEAFEDMVAWERYYDSSPDAKRAISSFVNRAKNELAAIRGEEKKP